MKAVVYEGPRRVSVKEVPDARIERPTDVRVRITSELPFDRAPEAYEHFDKRNEGWTKVVLHPTMVGAGA